MTNRKIVAVMGDQHANFRFGLCNPEVILDEGDEKLRPNLTYHQKTLWQFHQQDKDDVCKIAGEDEIVLFNLGELCHGTKYKSELVSTNPFNQYKIAAANLAPWLNLPNVKHVRLLKGTASHEDGPGSNARTVGDMLRREYKEKDIKVRYHFKTGVDGIDFDYAHHGPGPGIRNWLEGNVLVLYAQSIADGLLKEGRDPPGAILRAHHHQYRLRVSSRWARGKTWHTWCVLMPSYTYPSDYARKVAKSPDIVSIGMVAFEIIDGEIRQLHELVRKIDFVEREVL